jgi:hypothetical protein
MPAGLNHSQPLHQDARAVRSRSHPLRWALCWLAVAPLLGHADAAASAACAEQPGAERCEDAELLRQHQAGSAATGEIDSREIARRAAVRRNRQEQRAIRELLVQTTGLCQRKPEQYCASGNRIGCVAQLQQTCANLANRAAQCTAQAKQFCAQQRGIKDCLDKVGGQCPSLKRQNIDALLARYEELSPVQKARIKQLAKQLEENKDETMLGALVNDLLGLLGFTG